MIDQHSPLALAGLQQHWPKLKVLIRAPDETLLDVANAHRLRWPCDLTTLRQQLMGAPDSEKTAKARIWVADDVALNRDLLSAQLTALGHQCRVFARSQELFSAYRNTPYSVDLLLLDGQMPELDGFNLSGMIRQFEQSAKRTRIPIVLLSALSTEEAREHPDAKHIDAFLTKPVDAKRLQALLEKLLSAQATPQPVDEGYNTAFAQAYYAHTPHAFRHRGFAKSD